METRKRIRLHELRMGMFVEELDNQPRSADGPFRPFLISTPAQIAWLMRANVISVVINVQKGLDLQHSADSELKPAGIPINYRPPFRFEAGHYSNQLPAGSRL